MPTDTLYSKFKPSKYQFIFIVKALLISFTCIFCLSYFTYHYLVPPEKHIVFDESALSNSTFVIYFISLFLPLSYLFNCFLAKKWIIPDYKSLVMYMGLVLLCASSIEIMLDSLFVYFIDRPSWIYHIWPVHNGYTSGAMLFIWPWYGFHLYFFHKAMRLRKSKFTESAYTQMVMFSIDAMSLETIVNTFTLLLFNSYYFYYLKSDLYHFTTFEIFIPYLFTGFLNVIAIHFLDRKNMPRLWIGIIAFLLGIYSLLVLG